MIPAGTRQVRRVTRRRLAVVTAMVVGVLLAVAPAHAYWSATSTGSYARAQASTLSTPVLTAGTPTATTVPLSWTQPFTPTAYALGQSTGSLAGCSATPATNTTGCTATGLTPNTAYTWTLTANYNAWNVQTNVSVTTSKQATTTTLSNLTPTSNSAGGTFTAKATVTGNSGYGTPAGSVVFSLYTSSTCSGAASYTSSAQTLSGGATTGSVQATTPGTYYWRAVYTPSDTVNLTSTSACSSAITVTSGGTFAAAGTPTTVTTTTSNAVVTYPAGTASGDLVLLVIVNGSNQDSTVGSTGWTQIANPNIFGGMEMQAFWHKAGAETSVTLSSFKTGLSGATAWVLDYKNMANPAVAGVSSGTVSVASNTASPTSVTTTAANETVISLVGINVSNSLSLSTARSFTSRASLQNSTGGLGRGLGVADRFVTTAGAVTPPTWQQGGITTSQWAYITVGFTP